MFIEKRDIQSLKEEFLFSFRNHNGDKVTKFTPVSMGNAIAYSLSKLIAKVNSDAMIAERKQFPETAQSADLDSVVALFGFPARKVATAGRVLMVFFAEDAEYTGGMIVKSSSGVEYSLDNSFNIVGSSFSFVTATSTGTGSSQYVAKGSLLPNMVPEGHEKCYNVYPSIGMADAESDYVLRKRIASMNQNLLLSMEDYCHVVLHHLYGDVLRVALKKNNDAYKSNSLMILKNTALDFSPSDLTNRMTALKEYMQSSDATSVNVALENFAFQTISFSISVFPVDDTAPVLANILREIQVALILYLDPQIWPFEKRIRKDELLNIYRKIENVVDVVDASSTPFYDVLLPKNTLPKVGSVTVVNARTSSSVSSSVNPYKGLPKLSEQQLLRLSTLL